MKSSNTRETVESNGEEGKWTGDGEERWVDMRGKRARLVVWDDSKASRQGIGSRGGGVYSEAGWPGGGVKQEEGAK